MGTIGHGYGSEWHLLRYLGRHRQTFDHSIGEAMPDVRDIKWLDFPFDPGSRFLDREWKALEFLPNGHPAREAWPEFWPATGNVPNWDAVASLTLGGGGSGWLLVEAKAHLREMRGGCAAKPASENGGRERIERALDETRRAVGATATVDTWMSDYYQHANRLAALHHLNTHSAEETRLLEVFFLGDEHSGATGPKTSDEWGYELERRAAHLGLTGGSLIEQQAVRVFLRACPDKSP